MNYVGFRMVLRETFWQGEEWGQCTVGSCGIAVLMEYLHSVHQGVS